MFTVTLKRAVYIYCTVEKFIQYTMCKQWFLSYPLAISGLRNICCEQKHLGNKARWKLLKLQDKSFWHLPVITLIPFENHVPIGSEQHISTSITQRSGDKNIHCSWLLFYSNWFGQIPWKIHIISSENSQVEWKQLERNNTQDSLKAVNCMRQLNGFVGKFRAFCVFLRTQDDWTTLKVKFYS